MKAENPLLMRPNQTHLSGSSVESMAEQRLSLQLTQALAYLQIRARPLHAQDFGLGGDTFSFDLQLISLFG